MKKNLITLAVLATALLSSCVQEKSFNDRKPLEKGSLAFSINGITTRVGEASIPSRKGIVIPLENRLFLEETIAELNPSPATRGTPAYTQNVGTLYPTMEVYSSIADFNATFGVDDESGDGWRYSHHYGSVDPWPDKTSKVDFYLNMPASPAGVTFQSRAGGKTSFTYSSTDLTTAAAQNDILFAYKQLSKEDHDGYLPDGAPVLMVHALSGVKFAIANYDADEKITIKEVIFKGLIDTGTCEIAADGTVTWKNLGDPSTVGYSSGTFGAPVNFGKKITETNEETGEVTVKYEGGDSFTNNGKYPDSFAAAGNLDNLNDGDATQTFWFIPQTLTSNVKLTIKYTFGSDEVRTGVLDFGEYLNEKGTFAWQAGQLRTYTIRVDEVNVMITDDVTMTEASTETVTDDHGNSFPAVTYRGSKKENVVITNTGNTDAYIRAAIVGQWLDEEGNPVFGFTDYTTQDVNLVASWYQDQFGEGAQHKQGEFDGLPGENWVKKAEGGDISNTTFYYYYTEVVPAGEAIPDNLFTSYTVLAPPAVKVAGHVKDVYFRLEIATQAISAKKWDGTQWNSWEDAWNNAYSAYTTTTTN